MSLDHVTQNSEISTTRGAEAARRRGVLFSDIPASAAARAGQSGEETLHLLATLAAQHIPGGCGASIILGGAEGLDHAGVSAPFVGEIERVQQRLDQGPRIEAERKSDTVLSSSLTDDSRWTAFAREIDELDLGSALVQPLVTPLGVVGTLAVYGYGKNAFDAFAGQLAAAFVGPAALAAQAATWSSPAPQTPKDRSTDSEVGVIERALGIMMSRSACSQDRAILRLQRMSQAENQHLATMAQAVIDEALVETAANYVQVREPHRPFGRMAPASDLSGAGRSSWGHEVEGPLT